MTGYTLILLINKFLFIKNILVAFIAQWCFGRGFQNFQFEKKECIEKLQCNLSVLVDREREKHERDNKFRLLCLPI